MKYINTAISVTVLAVMIVMVIMALRNEWRGSLDDLPADEIARRVGG